MMRIRTFSIRSLSCEDRGRLFGFLSAFGAAPVADLEQFDAWLAIAAPVREMDWVVWLDRGVPIAGFVLETLHPGLPEACPVVEFYPAAKPISPAMQIAVKTQLAGWLKARNFAWAGSNVSDPDVATMWRQMGAKEVNRLEFFSVKRPRIDFQLLTQWRSGFNPKRFGLRAAFYPEIPDSLIEAHAELHTLLANNIRRRDYSWQTQKTPAWTRYRRAERILKGKSTPLYYLFDPDGKMVGMTVCNLDVNHPVSIRQKMTGVHPDWQGKGLAKWLKAELLFRLILQYPTVQSVETDCLDGNAPMMHINRMLGFEKQAGEEIEFRLEFAGA